nr:hypothetical protein [uncultured Psychroserpens sp.]
MKRILLLLTICLITFNTYSQTESNTVIIKSIETYGSFASMKKNLHIIDEKGEVTSIELEKHNTKGIPINMVTIKTALDKYLNQGYKMISSNAVSFGWNGVFTIEHTYILEKQIKTD